VVASLQAQAALDYLHRSVEHSLLGKLLYVDLNNYSMHRVDFRTATEPRGTPIELITANEIQTQDTVIDVRSSQEIEEQPQKFRVDQNINVEQINEARLKDQQGGGRLVLACKSGQRALFAAQELKHTGLENLAVIVP
jgi:rhodanese-related sulfurtransferase